MIVRCPKCPFEGRIAQDVPPLPSALGIFDCPMCFQAFVVWKHPAGEVRTSAVTRTGAPARAQT